MKITVIHGQSHKGSTYNIARQLCDKLGGEVTEFFLPRDLGEFCMGCTSCFADETKCPHYEKFRPLTEALDEADVIILASPVYVMHATGAMKAFLDHYGYRFMVHRPEEKMFSKQAVCIATAAGAGLGSTIKDMADSTFFWGIARTYRLGVAVMETNWENVRPKIKTKIDKKTTAIAAKISSRAGRCRPSLKTRVVFKAMSVMQRKGFNPPDVEYWKAKGWTAGKTPW
ncbi:NAD(P)H-dependent oxidoreductase [Ruminococcus sp.]|uniref:flavodoxin family protein n=1 Tax=Ruminococcus sp. TaxID=41978 RepID=UPI0025EC310C|nr:NAD(P)H-dependent oxidoreductase [Ruminococcus sp.]MBQ8967810.1 NAD(P)H-dependent oxidoreductase [Ruminococcus sp.]